MCAPIEDSDQSVHSQSPTRIFDGHSMGTVNLEIFVRILFP